MSVPTPLHTIINAFKTAPKPLRIELLLEYGKRVRPLPKELAALGYEMEQVTECQTPLFLATEFPDEDRVILHFDAPSEAPTTRGFAGILTEGLSGLPMEAVLETPDDFYLEMGLAEVISPLRLRGMAAMMTRLKRQIREHHEHTRSNEL
ncbi:MAG: SufE family protein [Trueperaceae bacterium]|nr:MAG: SufE family protein [Trueperaceae bacterium]